MEKSNMHNILKLIILHVISNMNISFQITGDRNDRIITGNFVQQG